MVFTSVMKASSRMRSTTSSISSTACASSALPSMNDSSARRTIALTAAAMRAISTGESHCGKLHHVHHALGDVHCLVADAFEIGIDLDHRENEAQVHGHGLLHGEQVEGSFVDLALGDVDAISPSSTNWQNEQIARRCMPGRRDPPPAPPVRPCGAVAARRSSSPC